MNRKYKKMVVKTLPFRGYCCWVFNNTISKFVQSHIIVDRPPHAPLHTKIDGHSHLTLHTTVDGPSHLPLHMTIDGPSHLSLYTIIDGHSYPSQHTTVDWPSHLPLHTTIDGSQSPRTPTHEHSRTPSANAPYTWHLTDPPTHPYIYHSRVLKAVDEFWLVTIFRRGKHA